MIISCQMRLFNLPHGVRSLICAWLDWFLLHSYFVVVLFCYLPLVLPLLLSIFLPHPHPHSHSLLLFLSHPHPHHLSLSLLLFILCTHSPWYPWYDPNHLQCIRILWREHRPCNNVSRVAYLLYLSLFKCVCVCVCVFVYTCVCVCVSMYVCVFLRQIKIKSDYYLFNTWKPILFQYF